MIYHTIDRDTRRFSFLAGGDEASVSQVKSIFEPVIDIVMRFRPPPEGDYFFVAGADQTSLFQTPIHDVPEGAVCACGSTAEKEQESWLRGWSILALPPRDNLILYNLQGINNRRLEIQGQGGSELMVHLHLAHGLAHELYHVKYHQGMLHSFEGEAEAFAVQRDFIRRSLPQFGLTAGTELWVQNVRQLERDAEKAWKERHPDWKPSGKPVSPRL